MSISATPESAWGRSANRASYFRGFIRHIHVLIQMGYARLEPSQLKTSEEPAITGKLRAAIREAMGDQTAPSWADRYFVQEEEPISTNRREGKRRRRVDIEFERGQRGPRPRFQFEAKRLRNDRSVGEYLGEDGIGCFLAGDDAYAQAQDEAGMLGYVQTYDECAWAAKIQARLGRNPTQYHLRGDGKWKRCRISSGPKHTYRTRHDRSKPPRPITVFHVLLKFC